MLYVNHWEKNKFLVTWVNSNDHLPDGLTKEGTSPDKLGNILSGYSNIKLL